jgi:hypothetical protein
VSAVDVPVNVQVMDELVFGQSIVLLMLNFWCGQECDDDVCDYDDHDAYDCDGDCYITIKTKDQI